MCVCVCSVCTIRRHAAKEKERMKQERMKKKMKEMKRSVAVFCRECQVKV